MPQHTDAQMNLPADLLRTLCPEMFDTTMCLDWLLLAIHGNREACPECGQEIQSAKQQIAFRTMRRVCCKNCGRWFDCKTGTILAATTLSPRRIVFLALHLAIGTPAREIAARIGIHESTVRDWRDRLTSGCSSLPLRE